MKPRTVFALMMLAPLSGQAPAASVETGQQAGQAGYRLTGDRALRPGRIWDDGMRTYIIWPAELELPAVFSIGSDGREMLADGAMREGQYVLDRVHTSLVFRIDRSVAKARRMAVRR